MMKAKSRERVERLFDNIMKRAGKPIDETVKKRICDILDQDVALRELEQARKDGQVH